MNTYQILAVTIPAAFSFLVYIVSKETQLRIKYEKELEIEKERNAHEIAMYEKRKQREQDLEANMRKFFEEKFESKITKMTGELGNLTEAVQLLNDKLKTNNN